MELNRLRYFCVVAETGSITEAARHLHLTPTALSKAVKVLAAEVGLQLIVPDGRGIRVTDEGLELARRAQPLLSEVLALPDQVAQSRTPGTTLRVASHEVFATYFTTRLLQHVPGASLEMRYFVPGQIEQSLVDGHTDVGLTYIPVPTSGVRHRKVATIPMGIFGAGDWTDVPFAELPFAAPARPLVGSPTRAYGLDGWPDDRIHRHIAHRVTNTETALELCRRRHAVAYFPEFVIELHNEVTRPRHQLQRQPDPPGMRAGTQTIHVARRTGTADTELVGAVEAACRELGQ